MLFCDVSFTWCFGGPPTCIRTLFLLVENILFIWIGHIHTIKILFIHLQLLDIGLHSFGSYEQCCYGYLHTSFCIDLFLVGPYLGGLLGYIENFFNIFRKLPNCFPKYWAILHSYWQHANAPDSTKPLPMNALFIHFSHFGGYIKYCSCFILHFPDSQESWIHPYITTWFA